MAETTMTTITSIASLRTGERILDDPSEHQTIVDEIVREVLMNTSDIGLTARNERISAAERADRLLSYYTDLGLAIEALVYADRATPIAEEILRRRAAGATVLTLAGRATGQSD